MNRRTQSTLTPIGLDVGTRYIKAVQAHRTGDAWRVSAAAAMPRATPGVPIGYEEIAVLMDLLDRQGFIGNDAVLAVPNDFLITSILDLPVRSESAPIDQIARMEMARLYKREPDSFQMACWALPQAARGSDTTGVMATACPHDQAEKLLDAIEPAGLNVVALETASCTLARVCQPLWADNDGLSGVLDLGWHAAHAVIMHQGNVIYERVIPEAGIELLHQQITKRTGLDEAVVGRLLSHHGVDAGDSPLEKGNGQALSWTSATGSYAETVTQELNRSLSYAAHRYPNAATQGVALTGGGAMKPWLVQEVEKAAGVTLHQASLNVLAACDTHLSEPGGSTLFTKALGLAQHTQG